MSEHVDIMYLSELHEMLCDEVAELHVVIHRMMNHLMKVPSLPIFSKSINQLTTEDVETVVDYGTLTDSVRMTTEKLKKLEVTLQEAKPVV